VLTPLPVLGDRRLPVLRQERHYARWTFERARPELAGAGPVLIYWYSLPGR
jgi:hypothetical protein